MTLPKSIQIKEVGPREGFQYEGIGQPDKISTADKIRLIDALSDTGVKEIQITSFVHPKQVPQMADAEAVVAGFTPRPGIEYTGIYLNDVGLKRALATGKLTVNGKLGLTASEVFAQRNQKRTLAEDYQMQLQTAQLYHSHGLHVEVASIMAAFGCNYEGDVSIERILDLTGKLCDVAETVGDKLQVIGLADTMGWANPEQIKRTVDAVRCKYPDLQIYLHLHDTRGLGISNVYAALTEGVEMFDTAVAGLGGCPFAGNKSAAGNVCSEEALFLCQELGIETGIDIDRMVACAELAESIVGHPLPSKILRGGSLSQFRKKRV